MALLVVVGVPEFAMSMWNWQVRKRVSLVLDTPTSGIHAYVHDRRPAEGLARVPVLDIMTYLEITAESLYVTLRMTTRRTWQTGTADEHGNGNCGRRRQHRQAAASKAKTTNSGETYQEDGSGGLPRGARGHSELTL